MKFYPRWGNSLLWKLLAGFKRQPDLQHLLREHIQRTTAIASKTQCPYNSSGSSIILLGIGIPYAGQILHAAYSLTADAAIALAIAVGSRPYDNAMLAAADVSGDNEVTSLDALLILQAAADAIDL